MIDTFVVVNTTLSTILLNITNGYNSSTERISYTTKPATSQQGSGLYTTKPATSQQGSGLPPHILTLHDWFLMAAFLIIMISGVAGNLLVIYVFGHKRDKKTTEHLILYLGIIDLMTSLFNPSLNIYWTYYGFIRWDFGRIGCKILPAIGPIMTTASGWVLLVFAVERYFAIAKPFSNRITSTSVRLACIGCVVFSTVMYIHYIYALTHIPKYGVCYVPKVEAPAYAYPNIIFIAVRLLAFLVIFVGTNILIYIALKQSREGFAQALLVGKLKEQRIRQSRRIMRILNVMGLVFFILVFPRELLYLVYNTSELIGHDLIQFGPAIIDLNSWLKVLHTSNSCANIFIYAYMQDSYKKQIRKILEWFGCYRYHFQRRSYNSVTKITTIETNNNEQNHTPAHNGHHFNRQHSVYRKPSTNKHGIPIQTAVFFKRAEQFRENPHGDVEFVSI